MSNNLLHPQLSDDAQLAVMQRDIEYIKCEVQNMSDKMDDKLVTRLEFDPIKKQVYALDLMILTAVVGAMIKMVLL